MAFFDNLGRSVNTATQGALKKTRDMADIAKLSSQVSDLNEKINQEYQSLGEKYFQLHSGSPESELEPMVSSIKSMKEQVADAEKQIQVLRGMVPCPNCGQMVQKDTAFCNQCGTRIIPENSMLCKKCNAVLPVGTPFCTFCGTKQGVDVPESVEAKPQICRNCGSTLSDEMLFCAKCGTRVEADNKDNSAPVEPLIQNDDLLDNMAFNSVPEEPAKQETSNAFCLECGASLEPGAVFCNNCGTRVDVTDGETPEPQAGTASVRVCNSCGSVVEADDVFCNNCGAKVIPETEAGINGNRCPNCGGELMPDAVFCLQCGTPVNQ